jgi:DNA-binding NarL/FixJ family response regulator
VLLVDDHQAFRVNGRRALEAAGYEVIGTAADGEQLGSAAAAAGVSSSQAQQALGSAQKLTACVASAGTNVSAIETCHAKFGN